jgi:hypothetical protein
MNSIRTTLAKPIMPPPISAETGVKLSISMDSHDNRTKAEPSRAAFRSIIQF